MDCRGLRRFSVDDSQSANKKWMLLRMFGCNRLSIVFDSRQQEGFLSIYFLDQFEEIKIGFVIQNLLK